MTKVEPSTVMSENVSAEMAHELVGAAAQKAKEMGKAVAIAVCDSGGTLKAFLRMDGAPVFGVEIAQNKAYTAAGFGVPTDAWYDLLKDDPVLVLGAPHIERMVILGGGYPLQVDGRLVGGLGVSGGSYEEDMECARAALEHAGFAG